MQRLERERVGLWEQQGQRPYNKKEFGNFFGSQGYHRRPERLGSLPRSLDRMDSSLLRGLPVSFPCLVNKTGESSVAALISVLAICFAVSSSLPFS